MGNMAKLKIYIIIRKTGQGGRPMYQKWKKSKIPPPLDSIDLFAFGAKWIFDYNLTPQTKIG